MAFQVIELELHTICNGQLCVNVTHWRGDTAQTNLFTLAKDFIANFEGSVGTSPFTAAVYMAPMSYQAFFSAAVARVVGLVPGAKFPKLYAADAFVGQDANGLYSQSVAANLKLVTASGPDYTGRVFYPGIPETAMVETRWTTTWEATMVTLIEAWTDGITISTETFLPVVYKRLDKTSEPVTNMVLTPNPGTIRKRLSPY